VSDAEGNEATAKWSFTVEFDTVPPNITVVSPQGEARVEETHVTDRKPVISASYTDDLSGVDETSVKLWLDGAPVTPDQVSKTQVIFTPKADLAYGRHTVKVEASDLATPTVNTATLEWSFIVEDTKVRIIQARNFPNPFATSTKIGFTLSRQANVTIEIYDMSMRLVRQLVRDETKEAGVVEYSWDGKTTEGDELARGVYFGQIILHSELKPESTVLKMALTR
jgi:hypothetical protein